MKELLFIHYSLCVGGAERVLINILQNIDYTKYNVTLLLIKATGALLGEIPQNVSLKYIHLQKKSFLERIFFRSKKILSYIEKRQLKKLLGNHFYDAIISFMEGPSLRYHSHLCTQAKKNISWVHTNLVNNHWSLKYFKSIKEEEFIYNEMDEVVFVSADTKKAFESIFSVQTNEKLTVFHNPIDRLSILSKSKVEKIIKKKFIIINVGRLAKEKNHIRLIDVAAKIKKFGNEQIEFWIVGSGYLDRVLKEKVEKQQLEDVVKFLGFQSNPYPYMAAADIFVLTSDVEGYPSVLCESLCLGVPIISTNVSGVKEMMNQDVGFICGNSVDEIASKILYLYENRSILDKMKKESFVLGKKLFDLDEAIQQLDRIFIG